MADRLLRVFVSSTTKDLGSYRKIVSETLLRAEMHPVVQEHFSPTAQFSTLKEALIAKVRTCDAVICLVGTVFGSAPSTSPERSYTQQEYDVTNELQKPLYLFLSCQACVLDDHEGEIESLKILQELYRAELMRSDYPFTYFNDREDLSNKIFQAALSIQRTVYAEDKPDKLVMREIRNRSVNRTSNLTQDCFAIKLYATYYNQGFINPGSPASRLLGEHGEDIKVVLGTGGDCVDSKINRTANLNGSVRLVGNNRAIAQWIQTHYRLFDTLKARVLDKNTVLLLLPDTAS